MKEKADNHGLGGPGTLGKMLRTSLTSLSSFLGLYQVWRQWSTVDRAMDLEAQLLG